MEIFHFLNYNRYWQIMEKSSSIFSEIFIFRVATLAVLLENSSRPNITFFSGDIFPFWAKMKTDITASCDEFCKNFLSQNHDHEI